MQYSEQKNPIAFPGLPDQVLASRSLLISHTLLHDVILLEVRAYSLKYAANMKRMMLKRTGELNDLIEQKINSDVTEDIDIVEVLKQEVQDIEDERDMAAARKYFTKMQLEGEKPTKFFCNLNKKRLAKAQFEELHVVEKNREGKEEVRVVTEQREIEWEVRKFYWHLYGEHEARVDKEEILQNIDGLVEMDPEDSQKLECGITEEEVSFTLKNTKNNIAPGPGGFGGGIL